jgi:protease PrsW
MRDKNLWKTGIINLLFQVIFLLALYFWGNDIQIGFSGITKVIFCLVFVLVPCIIWTLFFYLQDRIEPEPTQYVIVAFIAGMALASILYIPLEKEVFRFDLWLSTNLLTLSIGSLFLMGLTISFLFYISLRYGFYLSKEFDEPVDGMVYGAFIGSGFAAIKSIGFLFDTRNITLFAAGYTTSINILVYASIAAIIGFFIGKAKFKRTGKIINFILSIILGMVLIGVYNISTNVIYLQGNMSGFFYSSIIPLVISSLMLIIIYFEMRKLTKKDLHQDIIIEKNLDSVVILVFIILLVPGILFMHSFTKDEIFHQDKTGIEFCYPQKLNTSSQVQKTGLFDQVIFKKEKIQSKGSFKSLYTIALKQLPLDINNFNAKDILTIPDNNYPLNRDFIELNGMKGIRIKYCTLNSTENHEWYPNIILTIVTLLPLENQTILFYYSATTENYEDDIEIYDNILNSFHINKTGDKK